MKEIKTLQDLLNERKLEIKVEDKIKAFTEYVKSKGLVFDIESAYYLLPDSIINQFEEEMFIRIGIQSNKIEFWYGLKNDEFYSVHNKDSILYIQYIYADIKDINGVISTIDTIINEVFSFVQLVKGIGVKNG